MRYSDIEVASMLKLKVSLLSLSRNRSIVEEGNERKLSWLPVKSLKDIIDDTLYIFGSNTRESLILNKQCNFFVEHN